MPRVCYDEMDRTRVLRVNAPDWLERDDFRAWLRDACDPESDHRRVAMWGTPENPSDLFEPIERYEAADGTLLPRDICDWIEDQMEKIGMESGVLWLSFLPDLDC